MSASLRLSRVEPDGAAWHHVRRIADAAAATDGTAPFNEQTDLDLAARRRQAVLACTTGEAAPDEDGPSTQAVAVAVIGGGELDLVTDPTARGAGHATAVLTELLTGTQPVDVQSAWSHGDHPAARRLAEHFGFEAVRTLLRLRLQLPASAPTASAPAPALAPASVPAGGDSAGDERIEAFRPGMDDEEWVRLNARVFAAHPEQGAVTVGDLHDRMREPWFDAGDLLVARDATGSMIGYDWLKVEPGESAGEIYVLGVDSAHAGRGVGGRLLDAGLARLRERGCTSVLLYVEGDNEPALKLYRRAGFVDDLVDVQYRRSQAG